MQSETVGTVHKIRFDSVSELAEATKGKPNLRDKNDPEFTGVRNHTEAFTLAREGWSAELERTMRVAEEAVTKVERDYEMPSFVASYEVAGCEVDVARYLDGTPENMIDYPLTPIVKAGKVITLCASISYSGSIDESTIRRRGQTIAALALALSRLGYSTEIYSEVHAKGYSGKSVSVRTLVKGAQDALDAERIAYAVAHPSMLRVLNFTALRMAPEEFVTAIGYGSLGTPSDPVEDLPDGTLYLPSVRSSRDIPNADVQLVRWLTDLGIIHEEDTTD
jgi:hypothetical protein